MQDCIYTGVMCIVYIIISPLSGFIDDELLVECDVVVDEAVVDGSSVQTTRLLLPCCMAVVR